jgi:RNA recognition motif-containing protein
MVIRPPPIPRSLPPSSTLVSSPPILTLQLTSDRIYIKNLEERVNLDDLTKTLRALYSPFGTILDIVAKGSIGRRGQAFIVFDNVDSATRALEETQGFPLWDKQIVLEYARAKSDAFVQHTDDSQLEQHKRARLAEKGILSSLLCYLTNANNDNQNGNKQLKRRQQHLNAKFQLLHQMIPKRRPRFAGQALNPLPTLQLLSLTNTFHLTRLFSSKTYPMSLTILNASLSCLATLKDSVKFGWFLEEKELRSLSMRQSKVQLEQSSRWLILQWATRER